MAATVTIDVERPIEWWRPLVQWFLAIPHAIWTGVLGILSIPVGLLIGVAVLFTGKVPQGFARFVVLGLSERVRLFSYFYALRRDYPPFSGDDPRVTIDIPIAETLPRWSIFRFILAIPHFIVLGIIGGLVDAFLAILLLICAFGRGWSDTMQRLLIQMERWVVAVAAYAFVVAPDEYPRFGFAAYDD